MPGASSRTTPSLAERTAPRRAATPRGWRHAAFRGLERDGVPLSVLAHGEQVSYFVLPVAYGQSYP